MREEFEEYARIESEKNVAKIEILDERKKEIQAQKRAELQRSQEELMKLVKSLEDELGDNIVRYYLCNFPPLVFFCTTFKSPKGFCA